MPIVDVHTHMFTRRWLELLRTHGDPYGVQVRPDGREEIFRGVRSAGGNALWLFGL